MENNSISASTKLYNNRIVRFELLENKTELLAEECCDNHFYTRLKKSELKNFIDELTSIYNEMV